MNTEAEGETPWNGSSYNEVDESADPTQEELQVDFDHGKENGGCLNNAFSKSIVTKLDKVPRENRESYIYRVDDSLRLGNENHYEPHLFSIGPYYRGKSKLQHMEKYKWQSLKRMTEKVMEKGGISISVQINKYYEVLKGLEDDARAYYAESIGLEHDDYFLEMLLVDGCFLVETFHPQTSERYDLHLHYKMDWIIGILRHDLLLLENQLPFFVLNRLCEALMSPDEYNPFMLINSVVCRLPVNGYIRPNALGFREFLINIIGTDKLIPDISIQPMDRQHQQGRRECAKHLGIIDLPDIDPEKLQNTKHLLDLVYKFLLREDILDIQVATIIPVLDIPYLDKILSMAYVNTYSVTELSNAGIKFKTTTNKKFYDIQFKNGTLEIPVISIGGDGTEGLFRNLIAYERCSPIHGADKRRIVCDYICFMDSLINSSKDVVLLRIHGIIEHSLGDDEAVSTMFNKMGRIVEPSLQYYYSDTVKSLKHHCTKKRNIWMAKLRSDYFNSPWTIISVIAAFGLLVLTIIQAVYSPLSYYKG